MSPLSRCKRLFSRPHLRVISLVGLMVPRRLRRDWRQEWEAEFRYRELLLADWDRLNWRSKLNLLWRSTSAFWDALWLQPQRWEDEMSQDVRFGVRVLLKNPGFTLIAVLTLAFGIGANTAIFSLLDKVLIRELPVKQPHQLVAFVEDAAEVPRVFSYPDYADLRNRNEALSGVVAYFQRPFSLSAGNQAERVIGQIVSGNYFAVLGVQPALGRFFLHEEDRAPGAHPVAVIGHGLWRRNFGADPTVIGRTVRLNGYGFTVVGVAPSEFTGTTRGTVSDVYVPVMMTAQAQPDGCSLENRNCGWLQLIGRLRGNVSREQAEAALWPVLDDAAKGSSGKLDDGIVGAGKVLLIDGSRGHSDRVKDLALPLRLLMGVVGFVLMTACANVANLLLSRASLRRQEIAIRLASGASRWRIVRQLLTESTMLAALGGSSGLLVAHWLTNLLLAFQKQTSYVPRVFDSSLDARALSFTLSLSLLSVILFSLAPALQASKSDLAGAANKDTAVFGGSGQRFTLRNLLVVAQVALSLIVLVGAGLCIKSLRNLQAVDPGFEPAKVVTASFDFSLNGYNETRGRQFISQLSERVAILPGVEAVSLARIVAFSDVPWIGPAILAGSRPRPVIFNAVSPDYFRTLGTSMVEGRDFSAEDGTNAPRVFIVNEAMARRYWPGQDAIGKSLNGGTVIGVVRNNKEKSLTENPRPAIYLPLLQKYLPDVTLHVRTALAPQALLAALRREVRLLDATLPVYNLRTLAEQRDGSLYKERSSAALLTLFGALVVLLSAIGIYGVLSYAVTERTREIGIRLALGAQPAALLKIVVGHGMILELLGLFIGLGASAALTRLMQGLLFGVSATDPLTFAVIPVLLACVALLACWLPARRATRMNPLAALRYE